MKWATGIKHSCVCFLVCPSSSLGYWYFWLSFFRWLLDGERVFGRTVRVHAEAGLLKLARIVILRLYTVSCRHPSCPLRAVTPALPACPGMAKWKARNE